MDTTPPVDPSKKQTVASERPAENDPFSGPDIDLLKEALQK